MARELDNILFPASQISQVGVEGKTIAIIDVAFSSKMEHTSTDGRWGASTGVIYTGVISIHHICVGDGNGDGAGSSNVDDANNYIVSSSSLLYWGRTTKQTKEEIFQQCVVCVKNKRGPEGSRERKIHHAKSTKALSHTFGAVKKFSPKSLEGASDSTKYTNIKFEYVENSDKIKFLEARIMAYDTRYPFIITTQVDEQSGAIEDRWGNCAVPGV